METLRQLITIYRINLHYHASHNWECDLQIRYILNQLLSFSYRRYQKTLAIIPNMQLINYQRSDILHFIQSLASCGDV